VLALIERGYSPIISFIDLADDGPRSALIGGHEVLGTSSELTRNHMEIRGRR